MHYFYLQGSSPVRKIGILKAYSLATAFVLRTTEANRSFGFYSHLTSYLFRALFMATCVLWKVLSSSYCLEVDYESGKDSFNRAVSALKKCSVENNDIAGRQSEIMVQIWSSSEDNHDRTIFEPEVEHCSRYSASLAFDCLFYWRDQIGGQSRTGLQNSATSKFDPNIARCRLTE